MFTTDRSLALQGGFHDAPCVGGAQWVIRFAQAAHNVLGLTGVGGLRALPCGLNLSLGLPAANRGLVDFKHFSDPPACDPGFKHKIGREVLRDSVNLHSGGMKVRHRFQDHIRHGRSTSLAPDKSQLISHASDLTERVCVLTHEAPRFSSAPFVACFISHSPSFAHSLRQHPSCNAQRTEVALCMKLA